MTFQGVRRNFDGTQRLHWVKQDVIHSESSLVGLVNTIARAMAQIGELLIIIGTMGVLVLGLPAMMLTWRRPTSPEHMHAIKSPFFQNCLLIIGEVNVIQFRTLAIGLVNLRAHHAPKLLSRLSENNLNARFWANSSQNATPFATAYVIEQAGRSTALGLVRLKHAG